MKIVNKEIAYSEFSCSCSPNKGIQFVAHNMLLIMFVSEFIDDVKLLFS